MKVTVITPTTGNPFVTECMESVRDQTYEDVQHLIVVDGYERTQDFDQQLKSISNIDPRKTDIIILPYPTGTDRYNGHRIYGAATFIAKGDFFVFLDEDNVLEPYHVQTLVDLVEKENLHWAYSLRKIINKDSEFVCLDDCESLGKWNSVLHEKDFFVDVNCYFVRKDLATQIAPVWYRKAREPNVAEVDRVLAHTLMNNNLIFDCTKEYSVKYRVGNTTLSVQSEFFINGNEKMLQKYDGKLPWKVL